MNVSAERTRSVWMDRHLEIGARALERDEQADVVIVGAGITGLSVAYELTTRDRSVIVLDRGPVAAGMTARTTAHLASALDDRYHELINLRGASVARLYRDSQATAIDRMEAIQADEGIACDFRRVSGYLFAARPDDRSLLEREMEAASKVGLDVRWVDRLPTSRVNTGPCLCFPNQARVHPLEYLAGLVRALERRGARLHGGTPMTSVEEDANGVVVHTPRHQVRAQAAIIASNSPVNDWLAIHSKQAPYRTYAIAGPVPRGSVADALMWDTLDPYHYVRLQPGQSHDVLIIGGEDHRSGEADDMARRFDALVAWTRTHFPDFGEPTHRWSGQVLEPVDAVGFVGRNPGNERIYISTGDSGQGITTGAMAGMLIADLVTVGSSPWSEVYDPGRTPVAAAAEYVKENLGAVKNFTEYLTGGEVGSVDAVRPGQGAIVRDGLMKIAVYRDETNVLHQRSAVCSHAGCIVHWNALERCWDCPCHGSQFSVDGGVLNGPATAPLEPAGH